MFITGHNPKSEVLPGRERRRRTPAEKLAIIAETMEPGMTVSLVARRHGIAPNQLFTWRRLANQGALTATKAEEDVVPSSAYKALSDQVLSSDAKCNNPLPIWYRLGCSGPMGVSPCDPIRTFPKRKETRLAFCARPGTRSA